MAHHQFLLRAEDGIGSSSVFIASGKIKEREYNNLLLNEILVLKSSYLIFDSYMMIEKILDVCAQIFGDFFGKYNSILKI